MNKMQILSKLRAMAPELRARGVVGMSLFGSLARDEADVNSDIDIAVRLAGEFSKGGLDYFGKLDELRQDLAERLGTSVDLVEEPARRARFQAAIDRDRVVAF